jgi:hypothetical protein
MEVGALDITGTFDNDRLTGASSSDLIKGLGGDTVQAGALIESPASANASRVYRKSRVRVPPVAASL